MKTKIGIDQLHVTSFETGAGPEARRGTVHAHELTVTGACTCFATCQDSCAPSCFPTCWESCAPAETCTCA